MTKKHTREDALRESVAVQVRYFRHMRGLSQRELARAAGVSNATVNYIEEGTGNVSLDTLTKLATALNLTCRVTYAVGARVITGDDTEGRHA
jgi:transcriptional regulator with XRE-family HTH domain